MPPFRPQIPRGLAPAAPRLPMADPASAGGGVRALEQFGRTLGSFAEQGLAAVDAEMERRNRQKQASQLAALRANAQNQVSDFLLSLESDTDFSSYPERWQAFRETLLPQLQSSVDPEVWLAFDADWTAMTGSATRTIRRRALDLEQDELFAGTLRSLDSIVETGRRSGADRDQTLLLIEESLVDAVRDGLMTATEAERQRQRLTRQFDDLQEQARFDDVQRDILVRGGAAVLDDWTVTVSGDADPAFAPVGDTDVTDAIYTALTVAGTTLGEPIRISSGGRTAEENLAAGGASASQHLHGNAVDIPIGRDGAERARLVAALWHAGFSTFAEYNGHIHADMRPVIATWQGDPRQPSVLAAFSPEVAAFLDSVGWEPGRRADSYDRGEEGADVRTMYVPPAGLSASHQAQAIRLAEQDAEIVRRRAQAEADRLWADEAAALDRGDVDRLPANRVTRDMIDRASETPEQADRWWAEIEARRATGEAIFAARTAPPEALSAMEQDLERNVSGADYARELENYQTFLRATDDRRSEIQQDVEDRIAGEMAARSMGQDYPDPVTEEDLAAAYGEEEAVTRWSMIEYLRVLSDAGHDMRLQTPQQMAETLERLQPGVFDPDLASRVQEWVRLQAAAERVEGMRDDLGPAAFAEMVTPRLREEFANASTPQEMAEVMRLSMQVQADLGFDADEIQPYRPEIAAELVSRLSREAIPDSRERLAATMAWTTELGDARLVQSSLEMLTQAGLPYAMLDVLDIVETDPARFDIAARVMDELQAPEIEMPPDYSTNDRDNLEEEVDNLLMEGEGLGHALQARALGYGDIDAGVRLEQLRSVVLNLAERRLAIGGSARSSDVERAVEGAVADLTGHRRSYVDSGDVMVDALVAITLPSAVEVDEDDLERAAEAARDPLLYVMSDRISRDRLQVLAGLPEGPLSGDNLERFRLWVETQFETAVLADTGDGETYGVILRSPTPGRGRFLRDDEDHLITYTLPDLLRLTDQPSPLQAVEEFGEDRAREMGLIE